MTRKDKIKQFRTTFFSRGIISYLAVAFIVLFLIAAIFAPILTPYKPNDMNLRNSLATPSIKHLLGCDLHGRDVVTRLLYGARVSLVVSVFSCIIGAIMGMALGLIAGYTNGPLSTLIMRYVDVQLAIPPMLFTITIGILVGHSILGLIFALSFGMLPSYIRLMYGLVLSLKQSDYITALKFANVRTSKIIVRHLLPNAFPTMMVTFTMNLGGTIMLESTLSFLGIGIQQPTATWGSMVADGYQYIFDRPMLAFAPGLCLLLVVLAFNIAGDSLRDAIDPRLRGKL
ncbi:MAG: ABC transporter permease [Spirochaetales bacterium]|nr:ABC transporter permease [Spirochaetales bacterium]MBQ3697426.1 ABC transporter permease [Spirochaetales bacterium]MBQ3728066.1 ABC transporter permease [Spirochaetales bacterium]MBQ4280989.1 ABC transporter permease [Spirochaetales bacterium]MBQ4501994.1 ABC transporter permease [Spirochaetales bacterium]